MLHSGNLSISSPSRNGKLMVTSLGCRFEGAYPWFDSHANKMPKEKGKENVLDSCLDDTEVQTRMSHVIHKFRFLDLNTLDWSRSFEQLGLDEYEQTALLTSIEHEFHTVFEDRVFENFTNLN